MLIVVFSIPYEWESCNVKTFWIPAFDWMTFIRGSLT